MKPRLCFAMAIAALAIAARPGVYGSATRQPPSETEHA